MNNKREEVKKAIDEFVDFLKQHTGADVTVHETIPENKDLPASQEVEDVEKYFDSLKPKALDVLLDAEKGFFEAMAKLEKKHTSLTSAADIVKFTKDILKLCK